MDKFDWIFYLNRYPELYKNGIFNHETALKHWYEYGINEGKLCNNLSYKFSNKYINIDMQKVIPAISSLETSRLFLYIFFLFLLLLVSSACVFCIFLYF